MTAIRQRGFTLLEILVATVILAVMGVIAYRGIAEARVAVGNAEGHLDRLRHVQRCSVLRLDPELDPLHPQLGEREPRQQIEASPRGPPAARGGGQPVAGRGATARRIEVVDADCAEHGVPYTEAGLLESYGIVVRHLNRVGLSDRDPFTCPFVVEHRAG